MPSKIDKAFIDNLQNFTDSLEAIVELLKEQSKNEDAINSMLSAMDGPKMSQITEDIKKLTVSSEKIDNRTKQILEEVKAVRKQKEKGMFDKIQNKENKTKIIDSIKVITLIAGGVLAIGIAFKLIGKVDIGAVLSLSIGIVAIAYAFKQVSEIKGLTPKKTVVIGLAVVTIATAITLSSLILKWMYPLDIMQSISLILMSAALGIATFLMLKAIDKSKIGIRDIPKILLLPLILPAIAAGITISSFILQLIQPISFDKALSVAMIGLALIGAAIAFKFISKAIDKMTLEDLLWSSLAIPLISAGIVVSSLIFQLFKPINDPISLILGSLSMGIALIAFLPAMYVLSKSKLNPMQLLQGGLGVIITAVAITATSYILSVGNFDSNYPNASWSFGTGLALILFTPAMLILGIVATSGSGIGALAILAGAAMTLVVAATIVGTSYILKEGDYTGGPNLAWTASTGILIPLFGLSMLTLGAIAITGIGALAILAGASMTLVIAETIRDASFILKDGNYTGGPTKQWAEGIALSIGAFSTALSVAMNSGKGLFSSGIKPEDFVNFIRTVSLGMVESATILKTGDWNGSVPPKSWGEGVGAALLPFISAFDLIVSSDSSRRLIRDLQKSQNNGEESIFVFFMKEVARTMISVDQILQGQSWSGLNSLSSINIDGFTKFINSISLEKKKIEALQNFADALQDVSKSFNKLKGSGIEKLSNLTASVTILSSVDEKKLGDVIGVLHTNKDKLNDVTNAQNVSVKDKIKQSSAKVEKNDINNKDNNLSYAETLMIEKYDAMLLRMDTLLEYVLQEKTGENVNAKDSVK